MNEPIGLLPPPIQKISRETVVSDVGQHQVRPLNVVLYELSIARRIVGLIYRDVVLQRVTEVSVQPKLLQSLVIDLGHVWYWEICSGRGT